MKLKIESRNPIKIAYKALRSDWKFMREHGWTEAAYIARYGTTKNPTQGDGGPLIWQADLWNHLRIRRAFMDVNPRDADAAGLSRAWSFFHSRKETARFAALYAEGKKVGQSLSR